MTCTACAAPAATGITLCATDVARLSEVLDNIPDALEIAEDTIAKQSRTGAVGAAMGGAAESEAPINLTASERRTELWDAVVSYARLVLEHDDSDDLARVDPVVYLRMSTDLIQHQDFAGELLGDLERHHRAVMRVVDAAPDIILLGQCGVIHEGVPCPGNLRAEKGDRFTRCRVCGASHDAVEIQQEQVDNAWHHYSPLSTVVSVLRQAGYKINPRSARRWAEQGELPVLRYREDGVALYSPGQVRAAHERMKAKRGRPAKVA